MSDALRNCQEISVLLKYSPKRDALFRKIKAEIAPESTGFRILCPTRWTVRGKYLQSIYENYVFLRTMWDECLQTVKQPDIKARINGVKTQIEKFNFFFGIQFGERILKHTDNLSRALQNGAYSAAEGQIVAELSVRTLQSMPDDNSFGLFWAAVLSKSQRLQIAPPQLPRHRKVLAKLETGSSASEQMDCVKDLFRCQYFEAVDLVLNCIRARFDSLVIKSTKM